MKKNTTSLASQVTEESTTKPVSVDLADHVNLNDFIFDGNETETSISVQLRLLFGQNWMQPLLFSTVHSLLHDWCDCFRHCSPSFRWEQFVANWDYRNFVNVHRLLGTNRKTMNKRIRTDPHCFVSIVGPCGSGKTQLVSNMLKNQSKIFQPCFDKIV